MATVPLFMCVVFGIFIDRYMLFIGLGMTALMAIGVFLLEPWFYLWMEFVGGGGLIGTGLMIRKLWKQECCCLFALQPGSIDPVGFRAESERFRMRRTFICLAVVVVCQAFCAGHPVPALGQTAQKTVQWIRNTLVRVDSVGCYSRMIRLPDGEILCCVEKLGTSCVRRSLDNGTTWTDAVLVASSTYGIAANPELLLLSNGDVLLFYNLRPNDGVHRYSIRVVRSTDLGRTWSGDSQIYAADTSCKNGCWEPAALQLPSGEIQLVFANENPYRYSDEQEITLLRSFDNGLTWSQRKTVSFRSGHRDGMPVPLMLANDRGLVIAIEDNGLLGDFKVAIIYSSISDNWYQPYASGTSSRRWDPLRTPLPASDAAGAPYIRQLSTGETILSFAHIDSAREEPQMVVYVGDQDARNFEGRSIPFSLGPSSAGLWNSLFIKDDTTVTAISGFYGGIWAIDGKIVSLNYVSIADAKTLADDMPVGVSEVIITAKLGDRFYVEDPLRISGIGILGTTDFPEGSSVTVEGTLTTVYGERMIQPTLMH